MPSGFIDMSDLPERCYAGIPTSTRDVHYNRRVALTPWARGIPSLQATRNLAKALDCRVKPHGALILNGVSGTRRGRERRVARPCAAPGARGQRSDGVKPSDDEKGVRACPEGPASHQP